MPLQDWIQKYQFALQDMVSKTASFLPNLIGAIIVLIIGALLASILKWVVQWAVRAVRLQSIFDQLEFTKSLKAAKINTDLGLILGEFVRWITLIVFLIPAASILGLLQVSNIINSFLGYLPNVGSAVLILFLGVLVAEFIGSIVRATAASLGSRTATGLAVLTRNLIYVIVFLFAFLQLVTTPQVIYILLIGFVSAAAIGLGLAFGLGGKDAAGEFINRMKNEIQSK